MRWSQFYLFTTREVPRDAEVISHQLMVRSGMLKKLAAGIYTMMPMGQRSMAKLEAIVRRELDRSGALEVTMPTIQPAELWQESDRWSVYGKELLRIQDRHGRDFCYAPTAEEVITDAVRHDIRSYKQLPVSLYQIQTKFRDEIRPRFGLMRGREFLMKDAYSFHADADSLDQTYRAMHDAYCAILEACGLEYKVVDADTGNIGGKDSNEFMVLAETGESEIVSCECGYAANTEKAVTGELPSAPPLAAEEVAIEKVETPDLKAVPEVADFLDIEPSQMLKLMIYTSETEEPVAVAVRGDREINEIKLARLLGVDHPVLADDALVERVTGAPTGFAGPVGLSGVRFLVDRSAAALMSFACGANEVDAHFRFARWGRDADPGEVVDVLLADAGDPCPECDGTLQKTRGIETGHIFKLGTKYSENMSCNFLDAEGNDQPMIMGCYGLGIGRTVAAAIEQNHDDSGIVWPGPLAPFSVLLISLNPQDEEVVAATDELYGQLRNTGLEVLYDDRAERAGVKFNDADLIGIPVRVVVGKRGLKEGKIELSRRIDREKHLVDRADVVEKVVELSS
ncbi:MAG: proline--tRNA ligase [Thermoanaerobaculia bacterium]|nr:proline--tRNA ligase [Thermoanaerobaculia bacterium]